MKKFIILLLFASCSQQPQQPTYQVRTDGKDSVVYITLPPAQQQQGNNNNNSFFMDYMMFQMLMNQGGYDNVRNYHTTHITEINNYGPRYQSFKPSPHPSSIYTPKGRMYTEPVSAPEKRSISSPSRTNRVSTTSPSRTEYKTIKYESKASPSRQNYTPSSPSRSMPSPSRSTSSPSRSSSSPSRRR